MEVPHHGRWFEELEVGAVIPHALTRTVTETDNVLFTTMTLNPARIHLDADYAANEMEFGQPLVVQEIELAEPKAGEALVRLDALQRRPPLWSRGWQVIGLALFSAGFGISVQATGQEVADWLGGWTPTAG